MSAQLDKARAQAAAGKYKAAVDSIHYAVPGAAMAGDLQDAGDIIALVNEIEGHADRRLQADCREIRQSMEAVIERENGPAKQLQRVAFAHLSGCRLVACAGIDSKPSASREWNLAFTDDRVVLLPANDATPEETYELGWPGLEVDIEGAGQITSGGGFIGGGFGLAGAAAGMLTASVLNALTTSSSVDTVLHLQTADAEIYLFYGQLTPVALRRDLAPVFLRLRQEASAAPVTTSGEEHVVDRLHKLAGLLDRGLIDEGEFARLKADLMAGI